MQALFLSIGWGLAGVFGAAGIMKLRDRAGARRALVDFGMPVRWAAPAGTALPILEIALALGLVIPATSAASAAAGLVLLSVFIVAIGYNLAHGRAPECHCFGQLHAGTAGWQTLMRNVALAALALVLVAAGGTRAQRATIGGSVLGLSVLFVAAITFTTRRRATSVPPSPAPTVSERAPAFSLKDLDGETVGLDTLLAAAKPVVVIFYAPECGSCRTLLPIIGRWQAAYAGAITIAVVTRGGAELNRAAAAGPRTSRMLLQIDNEVAAQYGALWTPTAVLVRPDGTIRRPAAEGAEAIATLVTRAAGHVVLEGGPDTIDRMIEAALTSDAIPAKQPAIDVEPRDDGGLVLSDSIRQRVRSLNVAAAFIWECCDGAYSVDRIIAEMREIFPQATDAADRVREVLGQLLKDQMISVVSRTDW